jgi:hypothetical protein
MGMQHGYGHTDCTGTCSMDMDTQYGHGYAAGALKMQHVHTGTRSIDIVMKHGHGHTACTGTCSMDITMSMSLSQSFVHVSPSMSPCAFVHVSMFLCLLISVVPCPHVPCPCFHASMFPCLHVSMSPCFHVSMFPCLHVSMSPCFHVSMFPCLHVSMSTCFHVSMSPLFHVSTFPWPYPCFHVLIHCKQSSSSFSELQQLLCSSRLFCRIPCSFSSEFRIILHTKFRGILRKYKKFRLTRNSRNPLLWTPYYKDSSHCTFVQCTFQLIFLFSHFFYLLY